MTTTPSTSTIRAVVVDDEPLARTSIVALLRRDPDVDVVAECGSGTEAVAAIGRTQPDLIFLDVQMPEGGGFDVLERLGAGLVSEVVFVTAHDQYAVQAFEAGAIDYLVKPFDDDRFDVMLRRVKSRIRPRPGAPPLSGRLAIRSAGRITLVNVVDIDWIEAADYYASVHVGPKEHLVRRSIAQLERELDPEIFCRIHRSTLVNLNRVQAIVLNDAGEYDVLLGDKTRLRMSRRYRPRVQARVRRLGSIQPRR